jgi:hypothetical protein
MKIEEQHVFRFIFPFLGDVATFNVVANSQAEAAERIQKWMSDTMVELSMAFPKTQSQEPVKTEKPALEELKIGTLIEDLSKHLAPVRDHDTSLVDNTATVKEWLKIDYEQGNFVAIIEGLEKLKTMYETGKIKKAGR